MTPGVSTRETTPKRRQPKIGVIGAGTMGSGIAQVASTAGCQVQLVDTSKAAQERSAAHLQKVLARLVEKGRIDEREQERITAGIHYASGLTALEECDLVIEAIVEDAAIKEEVFTELEKWVSEDCIIASNTSSLSITSLAATLEHPERFIGAHFFNPAPLMKLVEIIPALQTDLKVTSKTKTLIDGWGKLTVLAKDTPGFIVNKVARPFYGEALRILEEGLADVSTIDWAMRDIGGFKMGPFELMDFIGNDVNYTVTETVFKAYYYEPRYRPSFTQKRLAEAGYLGRKSGRGYYDYRDGAINLETAKDELLGTEILHRILAMLINEAADTLQFGIATREDIDTAMLHGVNYPKGLFAWGEELGFDWVVKQMDDLYNRYHEDRYRCSGWLRSR